MEDNIAAMRAALAAGNADLFVDDDGDLVANVGGHFREMDNSIRTVDAFSRLLEFRRADGRPTSMPAKLGREFVRTALWEHWYKRESRGRCPGCAA
jgi:hypothetical protein